MGVVYDKNQMEEKHEKKRYDSGTGNDGDFAADDADSCYG